MSADRWSICPKCEKLVAIEKEKKEKELQKAYGKVTEKEFLAMLREREKPPMDPGYTLCEDYELYIEADGLFSVSYRAQCAVCGFKHEFKYREVLDLS